MYFEEEIKWMKKRNALRSLEAELCGKTKSEIERLIKDFKRVWQKEIIK